MYAASSETCENRSVSGKHDSAGPVIVPAAIEWHEGRPWSARYGDGYFSRDGGPAEAHAVFITGNRLEPRFAALAPGEQFTIGETGFGTGLNLLLATDRFRALAPPGARLALLSAELHPLAAADLKRLLQGLPALAESAGALLAGYPPPVPGRHRIQLADNVTLDLMLGDALAMWHEQRAAIDAWFLDGFAPARNPAMWTPALLTELGRCSRPGCTFSTFTAAGAVRRALGAAGFEVRRVAGHGAKRHRLEGAWPGTWRPARIRTGRVCVVGAGLAGATTARALAERGWQVEVRDPAGIAGGASGNRAGVIYTTPSGAWTVQNRFYQASYLHALRVFDRYSIASRGIGRLDGLIQWIVGTRQRRKLDAAWQSGRWPDALIDVLDDQRVRLPGAGWLQPPAWCAHLLDHPAIAFERRVAERPGRQSADAVVVCAGPASGALTGFELRLRNIRGQITELRATAASRAWREPQCHDGYLLPAVDGVHVIGASYDPDSIDLSPRDEDNTANLQRLARHLPQSWAALGGKSIEIAGARVGIRCQPRDYLPAVGPVPGTHNDPGPALWVNAGHGSRGITGTPLAAELIADRLSALPGLPDPALEAALDPARLLPTPPGPDSAG